MTKLLIVGVAVAATLSAGLAAAQAPAKAASAAVTFTKDVAPILQRSCQSCHRPGQMAPMSLLTYQDVRPWVRSIKQRVVSREMPPWGIDPHIGLQSFKNDPSLRQDEVDTIVKWVDSGAPMGNVADMIAHDQQTEGYLIISGSGTLVTGGKIVNGRKSPPESEVTKVLNGPSCSGMAVGADMVKKVVKTGDIIIIPANVPHGWTDITDHVDYLSFRPSARVLDAGYTNPAIKK